MLQVVSKIYVKEDQIDEFVEVFKGMVEPSRKEEGCIQYEMYQDEENPRIFIVLEQWKTKEDFDQHFKTEHFERIVPKMSEFMIKETEMNLCYKIV
ncbi:putative quinol monooxygenase [Crassaminicella profunda]|uniref:putative quinol monooxygenase n=1 Tax=Crassaminicella profunda TaxID=1286698 RepID=UPI001CA79681|nr:putative quinol monooxygenase [Crassaminicella profunda]QZY56191.1 antibiotic biosynthesis monooxygenase [Crassaminicella profunda]